MAVRLATRFSKIIIAQREGGDVYSTDAVDTSCTHQSTYCTGPSFSNFVLDFRSSKAQMRQLFPAGPAKISGSLRIATIFRVADRDLLSD